MNIFKRIRSWHRARLRNLDRKLLWPSICAQTQSRHEATHCFLVHASMDPAWCEELSADEVIAAVSAWPMESA